MKNALKEIVESFQESPATFNSFYMIRSHNKYTYMNAKTKNKIQAGRIMSHNKGGVAFILIQA